MNRQDVLTKMGSLSNKGIFAFLIYLFLFLASLPTCSQTPKGTFKKTSITIDQVSYDFNIISIKQDHQGYLWMATGDGLLKYDGYEFIRYRNIPGDSTSLINNYTESLYVDYTGDLWIGTSKGLSRYDSGCDYFFQYPSSPGDLTPTGFITSITEDASQNLWIGMQDGGLFRYERESDSFTRFLDDPKDSNTLVGEIVRVLLADRQNHIWIGTGFGSFQNAGGLIRFDPATGTSKRFLHEPNNANSLIDNRVSALMEDRDGRILAGTYQNGLHYYDPENDEFVRMVYDATHPDRLYPAPGHKVWENSPFITILHQDQKGGFWIGTCGGGINYFDPSTNKVSYFVHDSGKPTGIANDKLWSFFEDRSGQLWLGTLTQGGLHKMDPFTPKITRYTESNNMHVLRIHESGEKAGILFLGTYNHGLQQLDLKNDKIKPLFYKEIQESKFRESGVYEIYEDREGLLWLGFGAKSLQLETVTTVVGNGGLARFDPKSGKLGHYEIPTNKTLDLSINSVYRICEDRDGFLWLGTGKDGLFRFDKNQEIYKRFNLSGKERQTSSEIYLIEEDSAGTLWIGDLEGEGTLFRYNRENESFDSYLKGYKPISFYEDSFGWFWVGTENKGLLHFNPDKSSFHQYTSSDGLPSNKVVGILEGPRGIYWVSTYQGLSKFDSESERFTSKGLPSHRFDQAKLKSSDGQMFFAGSSVLFSLFPDQVSGNLIPPELILSGLKISGAPYDLKNRPNENTEKIVLAHTQNDIKFEYLGVHYSNSSKNQYKYKLEPYDLNWIEAGSQRTAQYTNLDPGEYNFRVIGSNDNDVWDQKGASVQFLIKTAWWSRWWAYLLYITFFCAIAYSFHRFQLSKKLALAEGKRQKKINQLKNNLYTNITHEFRTPLTVILGMTDSLESELKTDTSPSVTNAVQMIRRNGKSLLSLVNAMLDLSKVESGQIEAKRVQINVVAFIKYLGESFNSLACEEDIHFTVFSEIDELIMDIDSQKLSTIISNLLSNAIKFTPPHGKIVLHIHDENDSDLTIVVSDTGLGISKEELPHIFNRFYQAPHIVTGKGKGTGIGLALVKELVNELGGQILVESSPNEGSVFKVSLPITQNAPHASLESLSLNLESTAKLSDVQLGKNVIPTENSELPLALIIEDNKDVAYYLIQCLTGTYNTLHAINGVLGLEMAFEHIPDIIISDVMMPGKDGYDVCSVLKKDELTDHIPIIMLTAKTTIKDRLFGLSHGADAYLSKPFIKAELLTRMEQLILVRKKLIRKFENTGFGQLTLNRKIDPETKFIQKVVAHIHNKISDESFGPSQLAIDMFLSESQIYRKLKAISGKSTAIFIRSVRLQKAKNLLQSTDLNISEIAYEVGFTNLAWFSRVFKQEFGSSPTALRK